MDHISKRRICTYIIVGKHFTREYTLLQYLYVHVTRIGEVYISFTVYLVFHKQVLLDLDQSSTHLESHSHQDMNSHTAVCGSP